MSIGFNVKQIGYFKCTNGVRQGDSLSPLLFYIVEDVLSRGITNLVNTNKVNLINANMSCMLHSHTLFVYDIMIFCRGDSKSLKANSILLKEYGNYSGQFSSFSKSLIYVGGMTFARHCSLAAIIGFIKDEPPFIYIGVPIFVGKPKACHFLYIEDNIRLKLIVWKTKTSSMAEKVQLVASLLRSLSFG